MQEKKIRRIFNVIAIVLAVLFFAGVIVASVIGDMLDRGGFIKLGFFEFFIYYMVFFAPFLLAFEAIFAMIKEIVLYKKFGKNRKRFILSVVSLLLFAAAFLLLPFALGLSLLDEFIFFIPMTVFTVSGIVVFIVSRFVREKA